jgi:hypothetical protein
MRRFSRGNDPHVMRTGRSAVSRHDTCRERAFDEGTGGGRIDTGPDNCQEIVPKIRE